MHSDISYQILVYVNTFLALLIIFRKLDITTELICYLLYLKISILLIRIFSNICQSVVMLKLVFSDQIIILSATFLRNFSSLILDLVILIRVYFQLINFLLIDFQFSLLISFSLILICYLHHKICCQSDLTIFIIINDVI